jgi:hypothetical protein
VVVALIYSVLASFYWIEQIFWKFDYFLHLFFDECLLRVVVMTGVALGDITGIVKSRSISLLD